MPNPTSGFQLSALPQPLSVPTNIGVVDVGQMQNAYKNAMGAVQDTALFGQRLAQQKALLDYQTAQAQQQSRLLDPQEQALKETYAYQAGKAARDLRLLPHEEEALKAMHGANFYNSLTQASRSSAALPYAAKTGEMQARSELQDALTGGASRGLGAAVFGAPLVEDVMGQPTTQPTQAPAAQPAPAAPQAPAPAVPAPQQPVERPVELTPAGKALGSFMQAPVGPVATVQPAPTTALAATAPQEQAQPSNIEKIDGGYRISGVTVPDRMMQSPQIQDLVRQGFVPSGNARSWIQIDRENMTQRTATILPTGEIKFSEPVVFSAPRQKAIQMSEQATILAKQFDPDYKPIPTETGNIAAAANVYAAKKEINNANQAFPAVNPIAGIANPEKAAEALKKSRDQALVALDNDRQIMNDISKVRYSLNEFRELNSKIPTGPLADTVAAKYLTWGGQIEDFVRQLKDDKERSFVSENADTLNRMRVIHNEVIPGLIRSMNPKLVTQAGTQSGGVTGLGRIMFNEIPWLSSGSPTVSASGKVNTATIESALASMDKVQDMAEYRNQFFEDYGHLQGSTQNFNRYEAKHPYYTGAKINSDRPSWTEGLMSKQWRDQNGDAPRRTYQNVFTGQKAPSQTSVDVTKLPKGLSKEDFIKLVTGQNSATPNTD